MTLLAGFETLLYRYTDEDEFSIRCLIPEYISSDAFADAPYHKRFSRQSFFSRRICVRSRSAWWGTCGKAGRPRRLLTLSRPISQRNIRGTVKQRSADASNQDCVIGSLPVWPGG